MLPGPGNSGPAISLRLRPSAGLAAVLMLGWLPLLALAWAVARGTPFALPLMILVAALGLLTTARDALIDGGDVFADLMIRDNQLSSRAPTPREAHRGARVAWRLRGNCRLFARLAWLELEPEPDQGRNKLTRQRRRLIVTDLPVLANLPAEDFRRLRVWLRLGARYH